VTPLSPILFFESRYGLGFGPRGLYGTAKKSLHIFLVFHERLDCPNNHGMTSAVD
jgi:hypothetical protein